MTRADIRAYFETEAAAHPVPAGLRESLRQPEQALDAAPARTRWPAMVAAFVAVALAAGLVAIGTYERNLNRSAPVVGPKPSPIATSLPGNTNRLVEIDFVDSSTGFALLCAVPGGNGNCQYSTSSTTDAGVHWSKPVKVGPRVTQGDSGHHIHFANRRDGVMYGNSTAYVTHDGGRTWSALKMKFLEIVSIVGTSPMWMVMDPCDKGVVCSFQILKSTDGARTWSVASALPSWFVPAQVVAFGDGGLVVSTYGTGDMMISRDAAATWSPIAGRCRADTLANRIGTADGAEIWQMCTPMPPDPSHSTLPWGNAVEYTQDGGANWIGRALPAGTTEIIAAFGSGRVIEATNTAGLLVTQDGGKTWTQVVTNPQFFGVISLSWLPDGEAWAADVSGAIWATADYGVTWTKLPAQP
ncbi:MAG TPA: hypothetical protein VFB69_05460 [Candidatus Dormibacteraeota bacterium]|nr:hypothetical protein [Candidatus Dormibacteraeota bacterium]